MSVSSRVIGVRNANDEYNKKKAAWQACLDADVDPPEELFEYFGVGIFGELGFKMENILEKKLRLLGMILVKIN